MTDAVPQSTDRPAPPQAAGHDTIVILNVGGLPGDLAFELLEPLRDLFKDEVRMLGEELGRSAGIRFPVPDSQCGCSGK